MAKPLSLVFRGLRIDFASVILASKVGVGVGGLAVLGVWTGVLPAGVPGWVQLYGGASVAFALLYFLTRRFVPPTPVVTPVVPCPRCKKALHYVGFECPGCGVLSFGHDEVARELEA